MESTPPADISDASMEEQKVPSRGGPKDLNHKAKMLYLAIKAMTAMKLAKEDNQPAEIVERVFLGSVGAAFNKDSLKRNGITHILTCADNI